MSWFQERVKKFRAAMADAGLDGMFFLSDANVSYFSGFRGEESFLLLTKEKNYFLTDSRYTEQAERETVDHVILDYRKDGGLLPDMIASLARENGITRLGFEGDHVSYGLYRALEKACEGLQLVPAPLLAEELRKVKDGFEQEELRLACAATDRVFQAVCRFIRAGVTEREIEWEILRLIHDENCTESFRTIVVSGANGALPHGVATDRVVEPGDFITMDFGCCRNGYHADMTRTVSIGEPDALHKQVYDTVLQANLLAAASIRAGVTGKAADAVARDHIKAAGFGEYFGHGLGHGVGLEIHERPNLNLRDDSPLPAGAFVTVEPGIYIPGKLGVRIEDTVMVAETGIENMFTSTKELICL